MKTFNIHDAKTQLSRLVEMAVQGEPFVIARAGKPLVTVRRIEAQAPRRIGFMEGTFGVPDDFDQMFAGEIGAMFQGRRE